MKKIIILLFLLPGLIFAGAYFYGNTIQYLGSNNTLNGNFYFSAYKENTVYLEIYKVNIPIKNFVNSLLSGKDLFALYHKKYELLQSIEYSLKQKYLNKRINLSPKIGIYYLKLTNSYKFLASSYVFISNLKAININDGEKKYIYLRDTITGKPITHAEIILSNDNENKIENLNLSNGFIDVSKYTYSNIYIYTSNAFTALYNYVSGNSKFSVYITTDRPIYRPGQKVNFKGYFLKRIKNGLASMANQPVEVKIRDPNDNIIYDKKLKTNSFGTTNGNLILGNDAYVGYYEMLFDFGKYHFRNGFYVQTYKKPDMYITIKSDKKEYVYKDKMNYTITLKYFNQQPVVGAKTVVYIYVDNSNYSYYNQNSKLIYYNNFITDSNGKINLPVVLNEKTDGRCRIEVVASSETQREVNKTYSVKIYQGNISFKFDKPYYNVKPAETFKVTFLAKDLKGNSLSGTANATFCGKRYKANIVNGIGTLYLETNKIGNYPLLIKFKNCLYKVYVYSYEFSYQNYKPSDITIFTDKDKYLPGEKLKIAIYSPNSINGLIALAGEKLYSLKEINSTKNSIIETLPISKEMMERNLWVVYIPFSSYGKKYYTHKFSINLKDKKLEIKLSTDKKIYKPKEKVRLYIKTNADTEIAISVVDKAIYALVQQNSNIFDEIYPEFRYPHMEFSFSSNYIPYNLISKLQIPNIFAQTKKDYQFASFKSKQIIKTNVRKYFPDTALWIPSKEVKNGKCTLEFNLPDSITSWRIRAIGISKTLKVGESSTDIVSTKDFYIKPILPMFFREGDETQIGATVFNNTNVSTTVILEFSTSRNVNIKNNSKITFNIKAHSSQTFYKNCNISYPASIAAINIKAISSKFNDEVLYKIPVYPYTLNRNIYKLLILKNESIIYNIPKKDYYYLKLNILSSFKPVIKKSLEKLISYPYGCTEQTMSSFLPAIVSKNYAMKFKDLDDIIKKGLVKLFSYQHEDGGWGWWSRDKSLTWMTDYVMNGLYYAKKSGYDIPDIIIANGIKYIKKHIDGYGAYVLYLYGVKSDYIAKNVIDEVYLSYLDKSYLRSLVARMKKNNGYSYLDIKSNDYFTTNVQLNSVFLKSLIKWNYNSRVIKEVLNYIISKKDGNFWYDTKDTAFAAIALLYYDKTLRVNLNVENSSTSHNYTKSTSLNPAIYGNYNFSGSGIIEINGKYKEVPISSVNDGIKIERNLFKKIEVIGIDPKKKKTIIDAILPLNGNFIPTLVEADRFSKIFNYDNEVLLKYYGGKYSFEINKNYFIINKDGLFINGKQIIKAKITKIKADDKKVLIVSKDGYYTYDYKNLKFTKVEKIVDVDCAGKVTAILTSNYLKIIKINSVTIIKLHSLYKTVSILKGEIYLINEYINILNNNTIKQLYPVESDFILSLNTEKKELVLAGKVKFTGNNESIGPMGIYKIHYDNKNYNVKVGDIIMVKLNAICNSGNYILIEDYFPSCAQVLSKYSEKRFTGSYKLDYMWYGDWLYWYLSKQLRDEKIGFFTYSFKQNYITYFYKVTSKGKYKILPAQSYTMYKKGIYGQSKPAVLVVH